MDRDEKERTDRASGDTNGWIEIDVSALDPGDGNPIPFRLVANRFKSSTDDCEAFIHDPLGVFLAASTELDALSAVKPDWHVSTFVVNHHRTLSAMHLYALATVNAAESTVGVTLVKYPPPEA